MANTQNLGLLYLLTVAGLYAYQRYALPVLRLRRLNIRPARFAPRDDSQFDADTLSILGLPKDWLESQGFTLVARLNMQAMVSVDDHASPMPLDLYENTEGTGCTVGPRANPDGHVLYFLHFGTTLSDGIKVQTSNRELSSIIFRSGGIKSQPLYVASANEQLAAHQAALHGPALHEPNDIDSVVERSNQNMADMLMAAEAKGYIAISNGIGHYTWRGAWRLLHEVRVHTKRSRFAPRHVPLAFSEATLKAVERQQYDTHFRNMAALQERGYGNGGVLFLLSALGFFLLGSTAFDWSFAVALLLVLFLHELGHYIAMRGFAYRNVSIFFIPLLGAMTRGRKDDATPWQQILMLLAGPAPGILLACLIGWLVQHGQLTGALVALPHQVGQFAMAVLFLLLAINLLNLLPITPLDGGRVVELLFQGRRPRLYLGFHIACVLTLMLGALYLRDVSMLIVGVLLFFALRFHRRVARTLEVLATNPGPPSQRSEAVARLSSALGTDEARQWPLATRLNVFTLLLPRLLSPSLGKQQAVTGACLYLALVALPIYMVHTSSGEFSLPHYFASMRQQLTSPPLPTALQLALNNANSAEQRTKANLDAISYLESNPEHYDQASIQHYAEAAYRSVDASNIDSLTANKARLRYAQQLFLEPRQAQQSLKLVDQALLSLQVHAPGAHDLIAEALESKVRFGEDLTDPEKIALLTSAINQRGQQTDSFSQVLDSVELAGYYWELNQPEKAEQTLRQSLGQTTDAEINAEALGSLSWLLVAEGRNQEAVDLAQHYDHFAYDDYYEELNAARPAQAYALINTGHSEAAVAIFDKLIAQRPKPDSNQDEEDSDIVTYLFIDKLYALNKSGKTDAATQSALKQILSSRNHRDELLSDVHFRATDLTNIAAVHAQKQEQVLNDLGYTYDDDARCIPAASGAKSVVNKL